MPSQMVVNTESVVNYNNKLKQATPWMRLGINKNVNTKEVRQKQTGQQATLRIPLTTKRFNLSKAEKSAKREPEEDTSHDAVHDKTKLG